MMGLPAIFSNSIAALPTAIVLLVLLPRSQKLSHQINFCINNIMDFEQLRLVKAMPEENVVLIVRIGGFSVYFVQLSDEIQDDVACRKAGIDSAFLSALKSHAGAPAS